MTKHIAVQRRLHRFAYLIIWIILCYQLWFTHAILSLYFSSMSPAPELNTGNITLAETTSEAYRRRSICTLSGQFTLFLYKCDYETFNLFNFCGLFSGFVHSHDIVSRVTDSL